MLSVLQLIAVHFSGFSKALLEGGQKHSIVEWDEMLFNSVNNMCFCCEEITINHDTNVK